MHKNFYITTTLPYVNAEPHIGFAMEIVTADVIARYQEAMGKTVVFGTGTDEHGQKIYDKAVASHQTPQAYVDYFAHKFFGLKQMLNLNLTHFIRTTDAKHIRATQAFWDRCLNNGDIYKNHYQTKYCVGCELEKQDSDLKNNHCPLHPTLSLETRDEENYFFRFSKYQNKLLKLFEKNPNFVEPQGKMKEIKAFVAGGLKDFSISRLKSKMPWGIPVPNDDTHVMYVWFDALISYIATLGWPEEEKIFQQFWPGVQIAGKDNLRQQAAMWQAMLLSAKLPTSQKILINGFISINGQKMSKSLGNVISPDDLIASYGVDGTRWLLISLGPIGTDIDLNQEKLDQIYSSSLVNGLGNLCSRILKLAENTKLRHKDVALSQNTNLDPGFIELMEEFALEKARNWLNSKATALDLFLTQNKPWLLSGEAQKTLVITACHQLIQILHHAQFFMPETAKIVLNQFKQQEIKAIAPLFKKQNTFLKPK